MGLKYKSSTALKVICMKVWISIEENHILTYTLTYFAKYDFFASMLYFRLIILPC